MNKNQINIYEMQIICWPSLGYLYTLVDVPCKSDGNLQVEERYPKLYNL